MKTSEGEYEISGLEMDSRGRQVTRHGADVSCTIWCKRATGCQRLPTELRFVRIRGGKSNQTNRAKTWIPESRPKGFGPSPRENRPSTLHSGSRFTLRTLLHPLICGDVLSCCASRFLLAVCTRFHRPTQRPRNNVCTGAKASVHTRAVLDYPTA